MDGILNLELYPMNIMLTPGGHMYHSLLYFSYGAQLFTRKLGCLGTLGTLICRLPFYAVLLLESRCMLDVQYTEATRGYLTMTDSIKMYDQVFVLPTMGSSSVGSWD